MRESILYSAIRSLLVAFCAVIGICLAFIALSLLIAGLTSKTGAEGKLKTVNSEEIMPDANNERKLLADTSPVILQIDIHGVIGTEDLDTKTIKRQLIESREESYKNDRVKAVLVHINTPGGTVFDADGIYRALKEYKEKYKVPMYSYVDGLCASGGMYIAAATDQIFASDISLIGSVGVIAPAFMNFTKLLEKVGVETLTISAGKDKDAMNPLRPWKPGEEKNYEDIIKYYYQHFINIVTLNRPQISQDKLVKDYGAQIFNAKEALDYGFINGIDQSIGETIKALAKEAKIEGSYQVIKLENKSWFSNLFSAESSLLPLLKQGKIKHEFVIGSELPPSLQGKFLYYYNPLIQ